MNPREAIAKARAERAEPAVKKASKVFRDFVFANETQARLRDVASKYLDPAEIARCLLLAAARKPQIYDCTTESILRCMMEAAILGVRPGGTLGRGYLIPRRNRKVRGHPLELTFDPGWRGLSDIARRSKVVLGIEARVVYDKDEFRRYEGTSPRIEHVPYDGDEDPGELRYAYAVAFFEGGHTQFEVLSWRDIEKIKAASESRDERGQLVGPWVEWEDEMWKKSAVRRLCKHLPTDEELEYALEVATAAEAIDEEPDPVTVDAPPALGASRAQGLADRLRSRAQAPAEPAAP